MGGSFNPAHGGHRRIALGAIKALGLDEVWWLVTPGNPLKQGARDMAPLAARYRSAQKQARRAPIRVTAIERELGTHFTVDTLRLIKHRWPKRQFIWLMGADNLRQFHRWKDWRGLARTMPIAVIARPGYDGRAIGSPAMAWLHRFRRPLSHLTSRTRWTPPRLVHLRFNPDPRSATALRLADPDWAKGLSSCPIRDGLTRRRIPPFFTKA